MVKIGRLSTEGLDQKQAKAYWADHVGDACHGVSCDFDRAENFAATTEYIDFGFGKLTNFWVTDIKAERSSRHIARDGLDLLCLSYIRQGAGRMWSQKQSLEWRAGDVCFNPVMMPFQMEMGGPVEFTTFYFDDTWLRAIAPVPRELYFSELTGQSGWGRALAAMLSEITPQTIQKLALPASAVAENIVGVLSLAAGPDPDLRSSGRTLFERIKADLRDRLPQVNLSPSQVAADHGISVRTLHTLFMKAQTTFMAELVSLRLNRAYGILSDKRRTQLTISEIAHAVGFTSAEHFSTRFRKAFGMSPSQFRALVHENSFDD